MPSSNKAGHRTLAIAIPINLRSRLKLVAFASNRSPSEVVIDLLDKHLPQFDGIIPESAENT